MSPLDPDLAKYLDKMMRADLDSWSNVWFWALVVSTIIVAAGIICEAPEVWQAVGLGNIVARIRSFWYIRVRKVDLNGWERLCPNLVTNNSRHRKWIIRAGFTGWTLVAFGVAGEGVAEYFVNDAETGIRAFDEEVLAETQQSAISAATAASLANTFSSKAVAASSRALSQSGNAASKSKDAVVRAGRAEASLGRAESEARNAETSASNALNLATSAHQEADSFKSEIDSAKQLATEAKSQITDAFNQATEATAELNRLKTDRSLTDILAFISAMKPFAGTEFSFSGVFGDQESIHLASRISRALQDAGWKPVLPPYAFSIGPPHFKLKDFPHEVQEGIATGVSVQVETEETPDALNALPLLQRPPQTIAGWNLKIALAASIHPSQDDLTTTPLGILDDARYKGPQFKSVLIEVGKKP
jgi:hypothetical protein